jgi:hypothetical protein
MEGCDGKHKKGFQKVCDGGSLVNFSFIDPHSCTSFALEKCSTMSDS